MIRTRIGLWMLAALAAGLLGSSAQAQTFKPFTDVATVCPECWAQRYDHIALKGGQVVYARVLAENPAFYVLERFGELRAVGRDKVERIERHEALTAEQQASVRDQILFLDGSVLVGQITQEFQDTGWYQLEYGRYVHLASQTQISLVFKAGKEIFHAPPAK